VQASIFRSNTDPSKADRLLANAVLEGFRFEFGLRPFDMSVDILLRSLYVEDKMVDDDTEFRHLVTSEQLGGGHEADLVRIRYQGVQKASPEFMTVHEGIDKVSWVFGRVEASRCGSGSLFSLSDRDCSFRQTLPRWLMSSSPP
jgi:vacuolar protein sorting-associated protein 13A/C